MYSSNNSQSCLLAYRVAAHRRSIVAENHRAAISARNALSSIFYGWKLRELAGIAPARASYRNEMRSAAQSFIAILPLLKSALAYAASWHHFDANGDNESGNRRCSVRASEHRIAASAAVKAWQRNEMSRPSCIA